MAKDYAVVFEGTEMFDKNTVVEILEMNIEEGTFRAKPLNRDKEVIVQMEDSIVCEAVSKVIEAEDDLKVGDLFYEVDYRHEFRLVLGYTEDGKMRSVSHTKLKQLEEPTSTLSEEVLQRMLTTCRGLSTTAIEKVLTLGVADSKEDVAKIKEMHHELVRFWELPDHLINTFEVELRRVISTME